jgi:hypothetical protein
VHSRADRCQRGLPVLQPQNGSSVARREVPFFVKLRIVRDVGFRYDTESAVIQDAAQLQSRSLQRPGADQQEIRVAGFCVIRRSSPGAVKHAAAETDLRRCIR